MTCRSTIFRGLCALLIAGSVHAYSPTDDPQVTLGNLVKVNCATTPDECRYVAAVEVAAYFDACPRYWTASGGKPLSKEDAAWIASALQDWKALNPPALRAAVLAKDNRLRAYLVDRTTKYLKGLPVDDAAIECSRIASVKEQHPAEEMSDLLWMLHKSNPTIEPLLKPYSVLTPKVN